MIREAICFALYGGHPWAQTMGRRWFICGVNTPRPIA